MRDKPPRLSLWERGFLAFALILIGGFFGLFWLGVMMGDGPSGVPVDRSPAFFFGIAVVACWGGALYLLISYR